MRPHELPGSPLRFRSLHRVNGRQFARPTSATEKHIPYTPVQTFTPSDFFGPIIERIWCWLSVGYSMSFGGGGGGGSSGGAFRWSSGDDGYREAALALQERSKACFVRASHGARSPLDVERHPHALTRGSRPLFSAPGFDAEAARAAAAVASAERSAVEAAAAAEGHVGRQFFRRWDMLRKELAENLEDPDSESVLGKLNAEIKVREAEIEACRTEVTTRRLEQNKRMPETSFTLAERSEAVEKEHQCRQVESSQLREKEAAIAYVKGKATAEEARIQANYGQKRVSLEKEYPIFKAYSAAQTLKSDALYNAAVEKMAIRIQKVHERHPTDARKLALAEAHVHQYLEALRLKLAREVEIKVEIKVDNFWRRARKLADSASEKIHRMGLSPSERQEYDKQKAAKLAVEAEERAWRRSYDTARRQAVRKAKEAAKARNVAEREERVAKMARGTLK